MLVYYPEIKPYQRHQFDVEPPHQLYVDESGNPEGIPVLFVHDGPGAGCGRYDRRYFDPELYRIILFDQRGSGRSTPHTSLENTPQPIWWRTWKPSVKLWALKSGCCLVAPGGPRSVWCMRKPTPSG